MEGILIMISNYLHDLSVAVLLVSVLGAVWVGRKAGTVSPDAGRELWRISRRFRQAAWTSFILVLVFGLVRAVYYREFEWSTAVAHGQVAALVVKHIILVGITVFGIYHLVKLGRDEKRGQKIN